MSEETGKVYDNNLKGVLFLVPKEKRSEKHPIMKGSVNIADIKMNIAVWPKRTSKSGHDYFCITLSYPMGEDKRLINQLPKQDVQVPTGHIEVQTVPEDSEAPF